MNTLQENFAAAESLYRDAQEAVNKVPLPETDDAAAWEAAETEIERVYIAIGYNAIMDDYNAAVDALLNWSKGIALAMITNNEDREAVEAAYASRSMAMKLEA
jgi:uncharacterized protein (UPF0371 family)